ncbi:MAG: hypothetical protein ABSE86_19515 [Bryobacteraceae bacterium]|jgi:hypothetical protein
MAIVPAGLVSSEEISNRVHQLQMRYAGNPLVKGIDYRIGFDWSDDPAVFIDVMLTDKEIAASELQQLAENIRIDLLRLVRTDEIGLHSYLSFAS